MPMPPLTYPVSFDGVPSLLLLYSRDTVLHEHTHTHLQPNITSAHTHTHTPAQRQPIFKLTDRENGKGMQYVHRITHLHIYSRVSNFPYQCVFTTLTGPFPLPTIHQRMYIDNRSTWHCLCVGIIQCTTAGGWNGIYTNRIRNASEGSEKLGFGS